jgi:hypothetical protein
MARCPFAEWVPIPLTENQRNRKITPVGLVCHTAVSNSSLLRPTGEVRWHFYLNKTGKLYQFFDTGTYAPCQRDGNYWTRDGKGYGFLSCESWDGAGDVWDGERVDTCPPWTAAQMETWARLGAWLGNELGIQLVRATAPRGVGIGYHSQYTAPENSDVLKWNVSHACPARQRIAQMPTVIAAMKAAQEDDMPISDADARKIAAAVWGHRLDPGPFAERVGGYPPNTTYAAGGLLVGSDAYGREDHRMWPQVMQALADLAQPMTDEERSQLALQLAEQVREMTSATDSVEVESDDESGPATT